MSAADVQAALPDTPELRRRLRERDIPMSAALLFGYAARLILDDPDARRAGEAWVPVATVRDWLGRSYATLARAHARLRALDLLEVECVRRGGVTGYLYRIGAAARRPWRGEEDPCAT